MYPRNSPGPAQDPVTLVWAHNPAAVIGVVICVLLLIAWWREHGRTVMDTESDGRDRG